MALLLAGCGHYGDFTLPVLEGGSQGTVHLKLGEAPVLMRGSGGEWDSSDALNPSVLRRDGQFWNFYSGFDGKVWRTGAATSADGATWTKRGAVLSPEGGWEGSYIAANGSALWRNGEFLIWYEAGDKDGEKRIGLARCPTVCISGKSRSRCWMSVHTGAGTSGGGRSLCRGGRRLAVPLLSRAGPGSGASPAAHRSREVTRRHLLGEAAEQSGGGHLAAGQRRHG